MIGNADELDIVMPICNLLEYSASYSIRTESLWSYNIDEIDEIDDNASESELFKYKTKVIGKTPAQLRQSGNPGDEDQSLQPPVSSLNVEVTNPLNCLRSFGRFFDLPLANGR